MVRKRVKERQKEKIYQVMKRVLNDESDLEPEEWSYMICGDEYNRSQSFLPYLLMSITQMRFSEAFCTIDTQRR